MKKEGLELDDLVISRDIGDYGDKYLTARESRIYRIAEDQAYRTGLKLGLAFGLFGGMAFGIWSVGRLSLWVLLIFALITILPPLFYLLAVRRKWHHE